MLTFAVIFISVVCGGFFFWYMNRNKIGVLSEQLEDKNAIISALQNHTETIVETQHTFVKNDLNSEWRGSTNLTPTVAEATAKKPKKSYNKNNQNQTKGQTKGKSKVKEQTKTEKPKKVDEPKKSGKKKSS